MILDGGAIHLMENHEAAYYCWRDAGVKARSLVHLDAHNDMWWIPDIRSLTIANYICPAFQQGMVRAIYWVAPDASFLTRANRRALARHLERIVRKYPGGKILERPVRGSLNGKPLVICSLAELPRFQEPVLLDIDVDYLVLPRVTYGAGDLPPELPWRWPEELVDGLAQRGVRSDLLTIAYSVEGGYTPIEWKYLGDELALRLREGAAPQAMLELRQGARDEAAGDFQSAGRRYAEAARLLPNSAAGWWRLARLYARAGRMEEARAHYHRALEADSSYRSAFATRGILWQWKGMLGEAEVEYRRTLALDPSNVWALVGLAQIALARKQWEEAQHWTARALALDAESVDAVRARARLLEHHRRWQEAAAAYEQSMKLALKGRRPLGETIVTGEGRRLVDDAHAHTYARLGRLYEKLGQRARAINAYRIAAAAGYARSWLRLRLVKLCLAERRWQAAGGHLWRALNLAPAEARRLARKLRRRAGKAISSSARKALRRV